VNKMNCPKCGLLNSESALRCDCGYDFQTKTMQPSYLESGKTGGKKTWWQTYWPTIIDEKSAMVAARNGATAAFTVAAITGSLATLALFDILNLLDPTAFLDAALFFAVGLGVRIKYSRIAAVSGLLLYLLEVADRIVNPSVKTSSPVGVLTIMFILFFISGVRGTFGYQRFRKTPNTPTDLNATSA
jgi:hypothetical protein